jgi:hypothetical protein
MIDLVYRGFDGLDVSFQAQIPPRFEKALAEAKTKARNLRCTASLEWNGFHLAVLETGCRGGYSYIATTGQFGITLFCKKPNVFDPWGVRVSCNSFFLATCGLGGTRAGIYAILRSLGILVSPGAESIGRVDYALDFLMPELALVPDNFVMHSNARRSDHHDLNSLSAAGRSGRITSVTVGKMPGRQVIVYDKRCEIVAKHKPGWWEIWDATRGRAGLPPLARESAAKSTIWRVEIRSGKRHLKDRWKISTWGDLDSRYGDMVAACLDAVRYASPSSDSNRSRWPDSPLWLRVREETGRDLFEMRNFASPDLVKSVQMDEHDKLLAAQMGGLLAARAAIRGIDTMGLPSFAEISGKEMARQIERDPEGYAEKVAKAASRYHVQDLSCTELTPGA